MTERDFVAEATTPEEYRRGAGMTPDTPVPVARPDNEAAERLRYVLDDRDAITWLARATCNPRGPQAVDFDDAWAVITYLRRNGVVLVRVGEPEANR